MRNARWPLWVLGVVWLACFGCTTLREIPRSEYAARPERKHARVITREGLTYEFDYIRVEADTLVGFREREVESRVPDVAMLPIPLQEIARLSVRNVDWYRTGLIGGGVIVGVVTAGLVNANDQGTDSGSGGGKGKGGVPGGD